MKDLNKLCFLPGTFLPLKDGKYNYINLLKQGLTNLGVSFPSASLSEPANQIVYGTGSGVTSSSDLTYNGTTLFKVNPSSDIASFIIDLIGENIEAKVSDKGIKVNVSNVKIGDYDDIADGSKIVVDNSNDLAYYDNTAHTGKFGINNASPAYNFDLIGDIRTYGGDVGIFSNGTDKQVSIGDYVENNNGNILKIDDVASVSYYSNSGANGKFGINTATPTEAADIVGNLKVTGDGASLLTSVDADPTLSSSINISSAGGDGLNLRSRLIDLIGATNGNGITINDFSDKIFFTNSATDTKVGINTATPTVALDVVGNIKVDAGALQNDILTTDAINIGDIANNTYLSVLGSSNSDQINVSTLNGFNIIQGVLKVSDLAGTGSRAVLADASGVLSAPTIPEYANRTAALAGGLTAGMMYHLPISGDNKVICIV